MTVQDIQEAPSLQAKYAMERKAVRGASHGIQIRRNCWMHANRELVEPLLPDRNFFTTTKPPNLSIDALTASLDPMEPQPSQVNGTMKDYQLDGLRWLLKMDAYGLNGILGDEMGLGKTLQTIALLTALKYKFNNAGPHLVIVPMSVVESWMNEVQKWSPGLSIIRMHADEATRQVIKHDISTHHYDIVLTTYEQYVSEHHFFKHRCAWSYVILDEGHRIKNHETLISQHLHSINSQHRLILTGTPLQNNLTELWSLFSWLYPDVFTEKSIDAFKGAFDISKGSYALSFVEVAGKFLNTIMLRRMKHSVEISIPDKEEISIFVPLSPMQRVIYKSFLTNLDDAGLLQMLKDDSEHTAGVMQFREVSKVGMYQKMKALLFNLKMCCSHPFLLLNAPAPGLDDSVDMAVSASSKMILLDKMLPKLKAEGHRVLIFAQYIGVLDMLEDYMSVKGWSYGRIDGGVGRARRALDMKLFNSPDSDLFVFLLSTRAGGLGITLTAADTVIFYDSDWNPQVDLQAMARAHRIGQKNKVTVYRLCIQDTVEERLLARAQKKLWLSMKITEEEQKKKLFGSDDDVAGLGMNELLSTIKFGANCIFKSADNFQEFLKEDVDALINRSKHHASMTHDAELSLADFNAEREAPPADLRMFEGHVHKRAKKEDWVADWIKDIGEKRVRKSRVVKVDGHDVLEQTMYSDEAVPSIMTMLKVAGKENEFKDMYDLRKIERKKIAAAKQHQEICFNCQDGGELLLCSRCPRSYHLKCVGYKKNDARLRMQFNCPQHKCSECFKTASMAGGLMLTCQSCPVAYCADHAPADELIEYVGEFNDELAALGHEFKKHTYYIKCPDCKIQM